MSLRPELSGFDRKRLLGLCGTGDRAAAEALARELAQMVTFDDPGDLERSKNVIRRAVMEGIPFPDLETEGEPHVFAAIALANHDQRHRETGSSEWKMAAFDELGATIRGRIAPDAERLFSLFLEGRPLFGRRIETPWSYYAYFSLPEVKSLLATLEGYARTHGDDPTADGFLTELRSWMEEISHAGLDLWFYAY